MIKTDLNTLNKALSIPSIVSSQKNIGIDDRIMFYSNDGNVYITSFNGVTGSVSSYGAKELGFDNLDKNISVSSEMLVKNLNVFNKNDNINIKLQNNSLVIFSTDKNNKQEIPTFEENVKFPDINDFKHKFSIHRKSFLNGINGIYDSIGEERQLLHFTYCVIRTAGSRKARFAAGDNRKFSIIDYEGDNLVKSKNKTNNFLMDKSHVALLKKILPEINDEYIEFHDVKNSKHGYFILIKSKNHKVLLSRLENNVTWPDENKILNLDIDYSIVLKKEELKLAIKGIMATFNSDTSTHVTNVIINKKNTTFKFSGSNKALRNINVIDCNLSEKDKIEINFSTFYLNSIFNKMSGFTDYIQVDIIKSKEEHVKLPVIFHIHSKEKVSESLSELGYKNQDNFIENHRYILLPTQIK